MDIKWIDDGDGTLSARVGSVILLVTPRDGDVWTAQIKIKYGIVDDATFASREDAVRWCVRRLPDIVDPLVATARAEAALAEREACAVRIKQAADQLDAAAARIGELVAERDMAQAMIDELNGDLALVARERNEARAVLATARAEAALAEREACAQWFDDRAASHERSATLVTGNPASFGGGSVAQELAESLTTAGAQARLDARVIRARTAPATLSSDTLAAIAEARGLRLVEPEHLAELEGAARDASAAVMAEREACAVRIKQAADQLDAAAARIGGLIAERDMAQTMIDELNDDLARVARERNEARADAAAARAEAETIRERMPRPSALYQDSNALAERGEKDGTK